jgi:hypothetical protein
VIGVSPCNTTCAQKFDVYANQCQLWILARGTFYARRHIQYQTWYLDKNDLSYNEVLSVSVQYISKETYTDVAALISKTSIATFVTITSQTSLNMSFSVYTAEYLGAPNHKAIYIETNPTAPRMSERGCLYHVTRNLL